MIKFDAVSKRYAGAGEALSQVSFHVDRAEMIFITGHSGAGKSTLLKLLTLMERPSQGQMVVAGHNLARITPAQIPYYRRNLGVVFQDHQLLFDRSVFDNVALPLQVASVDAVDIGRRVRAALDKVGLLGKEKYFPVALSAGEQQRVGIARAVVNKPAILLADEPTGNLDPELSAEVMKVFQDFQQVGVTVLVATHDHELVHHMGHREIKLQQGRLVSANTGHNSA
jgi:cell division transport system ATP-binding protein